MNEQNNAGLDDIDAEIAQFEQELGISDTADAARNSLKFTDEQAGEIDAELGTDDQESLQQDGPSKSGSDTQTADKAGDTKPQEPNKAPEDKPKDPNAKEPSKYEKAREREERGWKKLQERNRQVSEEAAQVKAQQEKLEAEWKAFNEAKQAREAKAKSNEPSPEAYEQLAAEFEAKGDKDSLHQAKLARQLAAQRRKDIEAEKAAPQAPAKSALMPEAEFSQKQKAALAQLVTEFPEIKDANGDLNKSVQKMITEEAPVAELVESHPYGMYWVTKYARAERSAARVPDLEKQVTALNAELQKIRRNTDPISDHMVNPQLDSEDNFDDLPVDKMEAIVRSEMRAAGRL